MSGLAVLVYGLILLTLLATIVTGIAYVRARARTVIVSLGVALLSQLVFIGILIAHIR